MEYSTKAISAWGEAKERIGPMTTLKYGVVLYSIQIFLLINGNAFAEAGFSRDVATIYIILPLGYLVYAYKNQKVVDRLELGRMVKTGIVGFIITAPIVVGIYGYVLGWSFGSTDANAVLGTIITMVFFVAPIEELIFRGLLPNYMESVMPKKLLWPALLATQGMFSLMHYAAYQGNTFSLMIAFIIGTLWLLASRIPVGKGAGRHRLGIGFTTGSHMCYNLIVCGVLVGNINVVLGA